MILSEEVPLYGTAAIGFKLESEIRTSTSPIIDEAFEIIQKCVLDTASKNELKGLNLIQTNQLTQRTVMGAGIGDSRISELVLEFKYFKLYPTTITNFSKLLKKNLDIMSQEKKLFSNVSLRVRIPEEHKIPKSGFVVITATLSGFEQSMQNDSRKKMRLLEDKIKNSKIDIVQIAWLIIRGFVLGKKSTVGAQAKFLVNEMDSDKFQIIKKVVKKECEKFRIWSKVNIEYETDIWGVN